jgi:UDP-N-acetylmuramate--alanine ligase
MREFVRHVHFVGIGGAGMSGIAEVLLQQGYIVSGSDLAKNATMQRLAECGASLYFGHAAENISGADVVVVSTAIADTNVESVSARAKGVPVIPRAEMLGELMRFGHGIAVSGTHGKTTTTSLTAAILSQGGLDPTLIVGGLVNSIASNARFGKGTYLVAEADESDASFLHLQPRIAVVTNIDSDHMETYDGDFSRLRQTFTDFIHNLPFYGLAVMCMDDPVVRELVADVHRQVVSYGTGSDVAFRATDITQDGTTMHFKIDWAGREKPLSIQLALPGFHNVLNATAAIAIASLLKVEDADIVEALAQFGGIGRRMQDYGDILLGGKTVKLIDDYAHHPVELSATWSGATGAWPDRRIIPIFQPHRFTRTRDLFDDFVELLSHIHPLVIVEVYPAGESPIPGADGRALCRSIRSRGQSDPIFVERFEQLTEVLTSICTEGDVLLTLGAGDIGRYVANLAATHKVDSC